MSGNQAAAWRVYAVMLLQWDRDKYLDQLGADLVIFDEHPDKEAADDLLTRWEWDSARPSRLRRAREQGRWGG
ncbi:hypothetical protein D7D52_34155 [Nocardia yunnanensis]|uniref:Uncharacterized protein n=1 Tax=Nocardia yunnanensis TaxID=2382165 RepID=A0A386ZKC4_9NOCA|nr:hypothetical protein [Nocardia yunnanensis]AYF78031.1 hypothetical protein D7D52_34155 [Nocardia yunnanensis]